MRMNFGFIIAGALALVSNATAGCGDVSGLQPPFQFVQGADVTAMRAASGATAEPAGARFANPLTAVADPVGMWNITFLSQGNGSHNPSIPDGAVIDFGYAQWHSDGTEIMNSGAHAPSTQNFCLGVWVRTGMFTYELNHFALSYNASNGTLAGKVNIREQIVLGPSGNQFSGTFTIDVYDPGNAQRVDHLAGTIMATRVTIDQTQP